MYMIDLKLYLIFYLYMVTFYFLPKYKYIIELNATNMYI